MMIRTIDDWVPYDQCALWQIHDAYYNARGLDAWRQDIPSAATSNRLVARQHARLIMALVDEAEADGSLAPEAPVWLLEVGAGSGEFAAHFLEELEAECGPEGAALAKRVRYVMTDYAERNVIESSMRPSLKARVASGQVRLGRYDIDDPDWLHPVTPPDMTEAEAALELPRAIQAPIFAAMLNYVVCVTRSKQFRKHEDGTWHELHVHLEVEFSERWAYMTLERDQILAICRDAADMPEILQGFRVDFQWRPVDLDEVFGSRFHADVVRDALEGHGDATLIYPQASVAMFDALERRLKPIQHVLVTDYGLIDKRDLNGLNNPYLHAYGNALSHAVHFSVFDAMVAHSDWEMTRTDDPLATIQHLLLRHGRPVGAEVEATFDRLYRQGHQGQAWLDLRSAIQALEAHNARPLDLARFRRRLSALDPHDPIEALRYARACNDADFPFLALETLDAIETSPRPKDPAHGYDIERARATGGTGDLDGALELFHAALEARPRTSTCRYIAHVYMRQQRWREAHDILSRALEMDPEDPQNEATMELLKQTWWEHVTK